MVLKIIFTSLSIVFLIISSSLVYGQSADYEFKEKRFYDTPIFCIVENQQNSHYIGYITDGIRSWEKALYDSVSTQKERDKWRIFVSSVESREWWCDTMVFMVDAIDTPCNKISLGCAVRSSVMYFHIDNLYSMPVLYNTVQHETGHVFGLGHYVSENEKQNKAWQTYSHAPSVMIEGSHDNPKMFEITQLDINTIKQIYGQGFKDPARTESKQEQSKKDEQKIITSKPIPEWFKKNAVWWHDGLITDDDFLNAIKYMLKEGFEKHPTGLPRQCGDGDAGFLKSDAGSWAWGDGETFYDLLENFAVNCYLD